MIGRFIEIFVQSKARTSETAVCFWTFAEESYVLVGCIVENKTKLKVDFLEKNPDLLYNTQLYDL